MYISKYIYLEMTKQRFARSPIIIFFRRVFSECTEAVATSLIPLFTDFTEIFVFIIGFSFTVWTNMRLLLAHKLMVC